MQNEIVNRVTQSTLELFDLEDYYPEGKRMLFDVKDFLHEGIILKEKDFRHQIENHDWKQYQDAFVAIDCSEDAIVPVWAFMLVASKLNTYAKKVYKGNLQALESALFQEILATINFSYLKDKSVIIKGCSKKLVPESAYITAVEKIQPFAKSIMYGEACSAVPIYKLKKK